MAPRPRNCAGLTALIHGGAVSTPTSTVPTGLLPPTPHPMPLLLVVLLIIQVSKEMSFLYEAFPQLGEVLLLYTLVYFALFLCSSAAIQ